jgi:hypothetical protein
MGAAGGWSMRRKRHDFKSEAQLVEAARDWLCADGWDCYFEVAPWGAGAARADIVATRGPLLGVVECKLTLSMALLEQCRSWARYAHVTWAAVPWCSPSALQLDVCELVGCGLVSFGRFSDSGGSVKRAPPLRRRVDHEFMRRYLGEAEAATTPGSVSFATPFTATCTRLRALVRAQGGRIPVKEAIGQLEHHYSSPACARSSLISRAEAGVVDGVRVVREGRAVFFEEARS